MAVDRRGGAAETQRYPLAFIPAARLQFELAGNDFPRQHRGEQHAIVGETRLVAHDRDGIAAESARRELIDESCGSHPIADHHEGFTHSKHSVGWFTAAAVESLLVTRANHSLLTPYRFSKSTRDHACP